MDQRFHLFRADGATYEGPPSDPNEAERVEWSSMAHLRQEIAAQRVHDGLSLTALLWVLAGF